MGTLRTPEFLETEWLLEQMGKSRREFEIFTMNGLKDSWNPMEASGRGPVIGAEEFIERIQKKFVKREKDGSLTGLRELCKEGRVKDVEGGVKKLPCDEALKKKIRMYGLRRFTGFSLKEVGERVGGMSPVAVSQAVRRLEAVARRDKTVAALIKTLVSNVKP
jgi:hypothetical protein